MDKKGYYQRITINYISDNLEWIVKEIAELEKVSKRPYLDIFKLKFEMGLSNKAIAERLNYRDSYIRDVSNSIIIKYFNDALKVNQSSNNE